MITTTTNWLLLIYFRHPVENIISDLIDSDRLKKSRMNGVRQVKQTLRFGRRSDPWLVAPTVEEQLALDEIQSGDRHSIYPD